MLTLDPIKILQATRTEIANSGPFNKDAWYVICAAINHLIGARRISSVERLGLRD